MMGVQPTILLELTIRQMITPLGGSRKCSNLLMKRRYGFTVIFKRVTRENISVKPPVITDED